MFASCFGKCAGLNFFHRLPENFAKFKCYISEGWRNFIQKVTIVKTSEKAPPSEKTQSRQSMPLTMGEFVIKVKTNTSDSVASSAHSGFGTMKKIFVVNQETAKNVQKESDFEGVKIIELSEVPKPDSQIKYANICEFV